MSADRMFPGTIVVMGPNPALVGGGLRIAAGGREKPRSAIRPCRLGELEGRLRFWRCCPDFPRLARLL
jgi:hypothetical protein